MSDEAVAALSLDFASLYARTGRPSIALGLLLRADVVPQATEAALSVVRTASSSTASYRTSGQFRRRSTSVMISVAPVVSKCGAT